MFWLPPIDQSGPSATVTPAASAAGMSAVAPYSDTFECGDHTSFIPAIAIADSSAGPNAVPCVIATGGAYRHPAGVVSEPSAAYSPSAFASIPSPAWITYASVFPLAKFAHAVVALDGGYSALTCSLSWPSPFWEPSSERASEPTHRPIEPER